MKVLCTMPGKHGDQLWAMAVARAIAEANGGKVDLLLSPKYSSLAALLRQQPYLASVDIWPSWMVQESAPMTPWSPFEDSLHHQALNTPTGYDEIVHLGYRAWPDRPLPQCVYAQTEREYPGLKMAPLDLTRPWISTRSRFVSSEPVDIVVGFSDEWFELKYGIYCLLHRHFGQVRSISGSSRWEREAGLTPLSWIDAAERIAVSQVLVTCNSSLHVLGCAVGTPVVVLEPNKDRHNPVFWPYGFDGPQEYGVRGGDGLLTFDSRHCIETIERVLHVIQ